MRSKIQWRAVPRYIAIALGLLGYAVLIDHMVTLTLQRQPELSNADDGEEAQLVAPREPRWSIS